jgi:hypothetical protein
MGRPQCRGEVHTVGNLQELEAKSWMHLAEENPYEYLWGKL